MYKNQYYSMQTIIDTIMEYIGEQTVSKYPTSGECKAARMGAEGVIYALEDVPTADVVEVRHGRWEAIGNGYANCTSCGTIFETLPTEYVFERNNLYCRHCGAKMDGGNANE